MNSIVISERIFDKYPQFRRGIVIAKNMKNRTENSGLFELLNTALEERFDNPVNLENDPLITGWKEVHRSFQSNPNKFPPAHIALLKRIQKKRTQIPFINSVVSVMNTVSIRNILPVGGDEIIGPNLTYTLDYSDGSENFVPLGMPDKIEQPVPGEVIYLIKETNDVMCRRWNWRNGDKTKISGDTVNIVMNIDAVGEESDARVLTARNLVAEYLETYCGAETELTLLSPEYPEHSFNL